jgi:Fe-S oxidoreductase
VDIAKLKAEFLQHHYDAHGVPFRTRLIANFTKQMRLASLAPWAYNLVFKTPALRRIANRLVGFHPDRTMPLLARVTLKKWFNKRSPTPGPSPKGRGENSSPLGGGREGAARLVNVFCDEFTDYNDTEIGQKAVMLLERLGYRVVMPKHVESGRTYLSKGLVREAKAIAVENVTLLADVVSDESPLVGIEPSAILTFRDEYPELVPEPLREKSRKIAQNALMIDEFIAQEINKGNIRAEQFTAEARLIKLHGHCHQKALASVVPTKRMLSLPTNYRVELIPSGCCGMAGSFGYEREHYEVSMQIGELVLFPTVRRQAAEVIIAAPGTSCRHQIHDGTGRQALHPVEILYDALL